jgi:ribosome-associated toxin RatA of RatAB toxin-antitoxin module
MKLVDGPFSNLDGCWKFHPLGHGERAPARSTLDCATASRARRWPAVVGPVFDKIAGSLVDAFVKRAEQVYG